MTMEAAVPIRQVHHGTDDTGSLRVGVPLPSPSAELRPVHGPVGHTMLAYRWACFSYEGIQGRVLASSVVVTMMVAVVVMCLVFIIPIHMSKANDTMVMAWATRITSLMGSVMNLVLTLILFRICVALAQVLTRWGEMHGMQTESEDAFMLKVFVFQFVNFYSHPHRLLQGEISSTASHIHTQAFLLAFASDFLLHAYYWTRSPDMRGFITTAHAGMFLKRGLLVSVKVPNWNVVPGFLGRRWTISRTCLLAIHLAFVVVSEHVVFSIGHVLDLLVSDIKSVAIEVEQEYYLAKQVLAKNKDPPHDMGTSVGFPAEPLHPSMTQEQGLVLGLDTDRIPS
ncbi:LOW QUALITY PROTEIN: anoctamin-7 [Erethizon dorsatum]